MSLEGETTTLPGKCANPLGTPYKCHLTNIDTIIGSILHCEVNKKQVCSDGGTCCDLGTGGTRVCSSYQDKEACDEAGSDCEWQAQFNGNPKCSSTLSKNMGI